MKKVKHRQVIDNSLQTSSEMDHKKVVDVLSEEALLSFGHIRCFPSGFRARKSDGAEGCQTQARPSPAPGPRPSCAQRGFSPEGFSSAATYCSLALPLTLTRRHCRALSHTASFVRWDRWPFEQALEQRGDSSGSGIQSTRWVPGVSLEQRPLRQGDRRVGGRRRQR